MTEKIEQFRFRGSRTGRFFSEWENRYTNGHDAFAAVPGLDYQFRKVDAPAKAPGFYRYGAELYVKTPEGSWLQFDDLNGWEEMFFSSPETAEPVHVDKFVEWKA